MSPNRISAGQSLVRANQGAKAIKGRPSWDAPTQELTVLDGYRPGLAAVRYLDLVVLPEAKPVRKAWRPDLWPFRTWGPLLCLPALFCTLVLIVAVHALSTLAGAMTWTL